MDPAATRLRDRIKTSWTSPAGGWAGALGGVALAMLSGCSPKIGDHCVLNTDCGSSGTLVCDNSPPGGYCTQFNCTANACQNSATCVEFEPAVPGCPYDDYHAPSRTGRTFCMAHCNGNSDCRQNEGYICEDPTRPPWNAAIIDDNQSQKVCIAAFSSSSVRVPAEGGLPEGSVCSASGPVLDASLVFPEPDAAPEGAADAVAEVGPDAAETGADAGVDATSEGSADGSGDGAPDATDGGDGAADAAGDAAIDAGAADAPDGD
jgi:hypothetical protein